ncbi:MAG: hypothetical protein NVSMB5_11650 [Candidatus Velthaea sp.]
MNLRALAAPGLLAFVAAATIAASPVRTPQPNAANGNGGGITTKDFRIETADSQANMNTGDFMMPHHVKFLRPGTDVVGDSARGNYKNGTVTITGHVVLHDDGSSSEARQAGASQGGGPSTLECNELTVDSKRKVYVATGNVRFTQGTRSATAQNGRLDQGAHSLDLSGSVHLADGGSSLRAENVHYDTLTKDVNTSGSPMILTQPAGAAQPLGGSTGSTLPTPPPKKRK